MNKISTPGYLYVPSLDSRPIKIRPGTYCMVIGTHVLVYLPESEESPFSFTLLFSIYVHHLHSVVALFQKAFTLV